VVNRYADAGILTATDVDDAATVVTVEGLDMPSFVTTLLITGKLEAKTSDAVVEAYWSFHDSAHNHRLQVLERIGTDQTIGFGPHVVVTNSSGEFDVSMSRNGDDVLTLYSPAWYFPQGM
jgi:hypothetical protein